MRLLGFVSEDGPAAVRAGAIEDGGRDDYGVRGTGQALARGAVDLDGDAVEVVPYSGGRGRLV